MKDTIITKHGNSIFPAALSLNVDYLSIISAWSARVGECDPLDDIMGVGAVTSEDAADGAYWEIVKTCERAYFTSLTRTVALAIANALPCGYICISDDLRYNSTDFVAHWNATNPDQPPIHPNADYLLSI